MFNAAVRRQRRPLITMLARGLVDVPSPLYDEAVRLLRSLSGSHGIRASLSTTANYAAVFTRDAVMAGVAGLLTEDPIISRALARTVEHLRDLQGPEGQLASNYELHDGQPPRVSFGTLVPRIDATTWYMIGVALCVRAGLVDRVAFADSVRTVVRLLDALEYNGRHLVYVPVGGNWADEYVYEGYVLHDQVLRAWALRLAGDVFAEPAWLDKAGKIEGAIEANFWPGETDRRYPIAAYTPVRVHDMFDLATCSLLALSGVAPAIGARSLDFIADEWLARSALPPAFHPVIDRSHTEWPALSRYHLHGFRNHPHEYHNGGIWPIWLGWLGLALARRGRSADLERLRDAFARRVGTIDGYGFEEFFHGETGRSGGTAQMAYSATGVVFLRAAGASERLTLLAP